MNPPPPPPSRATSATIQRNADKIVAIVESERNNAIASLAPQLMNIEQHLIQLQGRFAVVPTLDAGAARELLHFQSHFAEFRNSCGVLAANAARIKELEELVAQLTLDNHGLHTSVSTAVRDAALALTKEEQARKALAAFLKQLAPLGIGQREDGTLGFSSDWKTILETLHSAISYDSSGKIDILQGLSVLAAKMRNAQEAKRSSENPAEILDLVSNSIAASSSQHS